jgi:hypothetical protein
MPICDMNSGSIMALYIIDNNKSADGPISPPAETLYAMYFDGYRSIAFADSFSELMRAISPGYEVFDDDTQAEIRRDLASSIALPLQSLRLIPETHEREQAVAIESYTRLITDGDYDAQDIAAWLDLPAAGDLLLPCLEENAYHKHIINDPRIGWVCTATDELLLLGLHSWSFIRLMKSE